MAAIEPAGTTTSNVVTYTVLIAPDKTDVQLLPDMTATVTVITQQADDAVLVPNSAISYAASQRATGASGGQGAAAGGQGSGGRQGGPRGQGGAATPGADASNPQQAAPAFNAAVLVLQNGAPVRVPIQTGITDGVNTQVLAGGLQPGDSVVTGAATTGSNSQSGSSGSSIFGFGGGGGGARPAGGGQGAQRPGG